MVMEANPTPQCVGREFVRQYYTLLNNAPAHLHRFYNNHSSFIHGGLDSRGESADPAIGQKQIHQKIQALNFQDCHAKINQVDSQMTLGSGVVVQVSGELSNAGNPMRRFTQTFVLAPQAPKKYYVHNDIFRYQDYEYTDEEEEELEGECHENPEREAEVENVRPEEEDVQQSQAQQMAAKLSNIEQHSTVQQPQQMAQIPQQQPMYYALSQPQIHPVIQQQVTLNGSVHEDSSIISQQPLQQPMQQPQYVSEPTSQEQYQPENEQDSQQSQQMAIKTESHSVSEEANEQSQNDQNYTSSIPENETDHQITTQNTNTGPKTYATLVKSFPSVGSTTSPQIPKPPTSPPPIQNLRIEDRQMSHQTSSGQALPSGNVSMNQHMHRMGSVPQQQTQQQQQYQQRIPRTGGPMQRDERRTSRPGGYPDAHQLFLGNLPHNASEHDLRQIFERYGRVADLRVHSKQNDRTKGPPGANNTRVPNYGFITFEDSSVVQKVLNDLPIWFPDENGQKLNVEEKKMRQREGGGGGGGSGRPNPGDANMRQVGSQQQQQQSQPQQQRGLGGPGMMRGSHGIRGRGGFNRAGGEGSRGGLRQPTGNPNNQNYQNRR